MQKNLLGRLMLDLDSSSLTNEEKTLLQNPHVGGVILFSRNIVSKNQVLSLCHQIAEVNPNLLIAVDQEGGRVNRLKNIISFDNLSSEFFGNKYVNNYKEFKFFYKLFVDKTSYLLKLIGANLNTVPVLDLRIKYASNVIGDRSFSSDPKIASKIGDYCIKYFHENGIGTVIKHIPGHGLAKVDSHHLTPIVKKKLKYLLKNDFITFKNKKTFFAMTAHIVFSEVDKINTVTHSKKMINLIRKKIGFKNILISDDLSMKSLKGSIKENTIKTFNAGCNLALHCNGNFKEMEIVGKNSPLIDKFISKKTSQFYKIIS